MMRFIAELKRRNVLRVSLVYIVAAWLIMQVADVMFPALRLPEWTITLVVALLIIGFPLAVALSWAFELTPDGLKPERVTANSDARPMPVAVPLASMVFVIVAASGAGYLFRSGTGVNDDAPGSLPEQSIAVLPFVSLSSDDDDQLFADGMSEELLNVLTQIGDLKVASRTSAFAFRNSDRSVRDIGQSLNVAHVLEGSVRRSGDRMRITAQLIDVAEDRHVWSENYDRNSADLIDIQEDIARRVAGALQLTLVGEDYAPLVNVGTRSGEAYRYYLEGRELLNRRGLDVARAIAKMEEATRLDPDYAQAYSALAVAHLVSANYLRTPTELARSRAESNARKAMTLDPQLAEPLGTLGGSKIEQNQWEEGIALFEQAQNLDPTDTTTLQWHAEALMYLGYHRAALQKIGKALDIDPESPILHLIAGNVHFVMDDFAKAKAEYRLAVQTGMATAILNVGLVELVEGDVELAAAHLTQKMNELQFLAAEDMPTMERFITGTVRGDLDVDEGLKAFPALAGDEDFRVTMYVYARESEKALRGIELDEDNDKDTFMKVWTKADPGIRKHPYFKTFVANTGLLDYWQKNGWPERCTSLDDGDFLCD